MQRLTRAFALLTSRLNSLDSLLTIVHLNIEERFLTIQRMDIERSIHERRAHQENAYNSN